MRYKGCAFLFVKVFSAILVVAGMITVLMGMVLFAGLQDLRDFENQIIPNTDFAACWWIIGTGTVSVLLGMILDAKFIEPYEFLSEFKGDANGCH